MFFVVKISYFHRKYEIASSKSKWNAVKRKNL